ncbi:hypothetical protein GOP47_0001097 [Adiantum capillus-veneris]|uniref:Uncharacterized protein n=1 Tax=Adiantum capillus-veneris TaxID=13818 RepID=A0A9D4VER6_ADICA|nr:hypothetical protein GOP47_0001097 [Adiantum capillus-veneris]
MACIRSFLGVGQALGYPSPLSALPQAINVIRSTSIDFAENQLYPILVIQIGKPGTEELSPLFEPHVQVSLHTAQMTNGKSRPRQLLVPAFQEPLGAFREKLEAKRNSVSLVSSMHETRRKGSWLSQGNPSGGSPATLA